MAKNTFKVGISTNLPVWLLTDIGYSPLNGQISLGSESLKLFTSFENLKSYVKRNADSYSFWSKVFLIVSVFLAACTSYRVYNKLSERRREAPAQPAAQHLH